MTRVRKASRCSDALSDRWAFTYQSCFQASAARSCGRGRDTTQRGQLEQRRAQKEEWVSRRSQYLEVVVLRSDMVNGGVHLGEDVHHPLSQLRRVHGICFILKTMPLGRCVFGNKRGTVSGEERHLGRRGARPDMRTFVADWGALFTKTGMTS